MIRYRFEQDTKTEGLWTSPDIFEARDMCDVRRAVTQGWTGEPRRAIDADSGAVLYGLDAKGKAL